MKIGLERPRRRGPGSTERGAIPSDARRRSPTQPSSPLVAHERAEPRQRARRSRARSGRRCASTFHGGSASQSASDAEADPARSRSSRALAEPSHAVVRRRAPRTCSRLQLRLRRAPGPAKPTRRRSPTGETIRSSAPTKRMISAWIIVARLPASSAGKTSGSSWRGRRADLQRAEEERGEEDPDRLVAAEQRDRDADEADDADVEVVRRDRNFQPSTSTAPARPANAPEIASARK